MKEQSPFSPGRPVPIEYFVGRIDEIKRIERALRQSAQGTNQNIFITGERGIGKSSLASFARYLAEREHQFIGAHSFLGSARSVHDVCAIVFKQLLQASSGNTLFEKVKRTLTKYISSVDVFGLTVELSNDARSKESLLSNFLPVLREIIENIKEDRKGICLVLDDLNGIAKVPGFAHFIKSVVDEIATNQKWLTPLTLILVGTPERMDDLREQQPSISRIFEVVELSIMGPEESTSFFEKAFTSVGATLQEAATEIMVKYSGGFPVLLHEVGDAVFWEDRDSSIDIRDALFGVGVAAENVGRKYLDRQVYQTIKSKIYRSILTKIAAHRRIMSTDEQAIIRKEMLGKMSESEKKNFGNFIQKMKKLGVLKDGEDRGTYVFTNELYGLYIAMEAGERRFSVII